MRRIGAAASSLAVVVLTVGGCGSTGDETAEPSATQSTQMVLTSPVLSASGEIPPSHPCAMTPWLPLQWRGVPRGSAELVLAIVMSSQSPGEGSTTSSFAAGWLVSGLNPRLRALDAGELPGKASLLTYPQGDPCPDDLARKTFLFRLYALDPASRISGKPLSLETPMELYQEALAVAEFSAFYATPGSRP